MPTTMQDRTIVTMKH